MKYIAAIFIAFVFLPIPSQAQFPASNIEAFDACNIDALKNRSMANFNSDREQRAEAQRLLGDLYAEGKCTPRNMALATVYYSGALRERDPEGFTKLKNLADNNNADAQYKLYDVSMSGSPKAAAYVSQSDGIEWLHKAAEQGHPEAASRLGRWYCEKASAVRDGDYTECFKWTSKAAEVGHGDAKYGLSGQYERGLGVQKDIKTGFLLLQEAAGLGHCQAIEKLSKSYHEGKNVTQNDE